MKINLKAHKIIMIIVAVAAVFWSQARAEAATMDVQVCNNQTTNVTVNVNDTGVITPNTANFVADNLAGGATQVTKWQFSSYNNQVIQVNETTGAYQAVSSGTATVCVYGLSEYGSTLFYGYCYFNVNVDMTNVTLNKSSIKEYVAGYEGVTSTVAVNSTVVLNEDNSDVTVTSSNTAMSFWCSLSNNQLQIQTSSIGSTTLTIVINGKTFTVEYHVVQLEMSKRSYVTSKGKKFTLRVKKISAGVEWSSSNSKVAKVSASGKVRCKKIGNAVITAKIGDKRVGCAVSVITPKLLKVIKTAKKIGTSWTYSQPKRMQNGFYDCSSLVWKSYSKIGKKFGLANYAPVAADLAKWCAKHGKVLSKAYTSNDIQKMKFRPGDLMFETGQNNGRYKGIYHVEMFVGYAVRYYEGDTPVLSELWAARTEGYYGGGGLMERP